MERAQAFDLISHAIDEGREANGYLIVGDIEGEAIPLAEEILLKLFPKDKNLVESKSHPDIAWLFPQGRSRTIKVERTKDDDGPGMRDGIIEPMSTTSFSGGWKAGIISGADRMQPAAANAFLKTLEEPPPKTIFLLLTDNPDAILPTIVSRTQRVDLPLSEGLLTGKKYDDVARIMGSPDLAGTIEKARAGHALAAVLAEIKDEAEAAGYAIERKKFYKTILSFARKWMIEGALRRDRAFRNIELVEEAYARSEKSISDESVLCAMTDRMTFP